MEILKEMHPIDETLDMVVCYRMRSTDTAWTKMEGRVSVPFDRGAKKLRVFYPDEWVPFYISAYPHVYRRGIAWYPVKHDDPELVKGLFLARKRDEQLALLKYAGIIDKQIEYLESVDE